MVPPCGAGAIPGAASAFTIPVPGCGGVSVEHVALLSSLASETVASFTAPSVATLASLPASVPVDVFTLVFDELQACIETHPKTANIARAATSLIRRYMRRTLHAPVSAQ
jgi:hypothetical protein